MPISPRMDRLNKTREAVPGWPDAELHELRAGSDRRGRANAAAIARAPEPEARALPMALTRFGLAPDEIIGGHQAGKVPSMHAAPALGGSGLWRTLAGMRVAVRAQPIVRGPASRVARAWPAGATRAFDNMVLRRI